MGRAKPAARSPLKKCPANRSDELAWIKRGLSPSPVETMTLCSKINNASRLLPDRHVLKEETAIRKHIQGGGGGKHCLLFPGLLLHFALNESVDKMKEQAQEQRPDPKKIPLSTMKAFAGGPCCCNPSRGHYAPGPMPQTLTQIKKIKAQRLWALVEQELQRS